MVLGLPEEKLNQLNHALALSRIRFDTASDFIFAPHVNVIYERSGERLWELLHSALKGQHYVPELPVKVEVPKPSGFSRPGVILSPFDRLAYQLTVDALVPQAEASLDRDRVFSYVPLGNDPQGSMFEPPGESYRRFTERVAVLARDPQYPFALRVDVSSYFERIYQHNLVNGLESASCDPVLVDFLKHLLSCFTEKDSHGIVQGVFPSDFLGTFYLGAVDDQHRASRIPSARYVDDMYLFFRSKRDARVHQVILASWLRRKALSLNEAKCELAPSMNLLDKETKVTHLFEAARQEVLEDFLERNDPYFSLAVPWDFANEYGLVDFDDVDNIELEAIRSLFSLLDEIDEDERLYGQIEKYCLSAFAKAGDSIAVDYVLKQFPLRPHMACVYAVYLGSLALRDPQVARTAQILTTEPDMCFDFQVMWLCAVLTNSDGLSTDTLDWALRGLSNHNSSVALRAIYPVLLGRFGGPSQHRLLRESYADEPSSYVRAATLYSARYLPKNEQDICIGNWETASPLNSLIAGTLHSLRRSG